MATLTTEWQDLGYSGWTNISGANLTLQGKYTEQSVSGNSTTMQFRHIAGGTQGIRTTNGSASYKGSYIDNFNIATYPDYIMPNSVIMYMEKTIVHDNDGSKSISLGSFGWIDLNDGRHSFDIPEVSITIPKIDRISTLALSSQDFNIGDTIQASITQYVVGYHQDLYMEINGVETLIQSSATGTIDIDTSLLANTIYQAIPSSQYLSGEFRLKTFDSNNTLVGTDVKTYKANVVGSNPTFNLAYEDTNATTTSITQNNQQIIQSHSTLRIKITNATALHYASLSSVSVNINGAITTTSISSATKNIDIGTLNLSSNTNAVVSLTDSRGFTTTQTIELTILEWHMPIPNAVIQRQANFYDDTDITVNLDYSSLDGKNVIDLKYRYKQIIAGQTTQWSNYFPLTNGTTETVQLDNKYKWIIEIYGGDALYQNTIYNTFVGVGIPAFFIDRAKHSIGIDCMPNNNSSVEVGGIDISNVYSQTQKAIGKWINGDYIYRKVLTSTGNTGTNVSIAHNITGLGTVIDFKAIASDDSGLAYPLNNTSYDLEVVGIDTTNIIMNISSGFSSGWTIYYIIDYTITI